MNLKPGVVDSLLLLAMIMLNLSQLYLLNNTVGPLVLDVRYRKQPKACFIHRTTSIPDPPKLDILSGIRGSGIGVISGIGNMKQVSYTGQSFVWYKGIGVYRTSGVEGLTVPSNVKNRDDVSILTRFGMSQEWIRKNLHL